MGSSRGWCRENKRLASEIPPGSLGHTMGAGVLVGKEMEETSVGKAELLLKEQPHEMAAEFAASARC